MKLRWTLILGLGLLGPVVGLALVMGWVPVGWERVVWAVVIAVSAVVVARRQQGENVFYNGAAAGFVAGAAGTLVQGIFSDTMIMNNPGMLDRVSKISEGSDFQFFTMLLVPFIGVAGALLTGLASHAAAHVMSSRKQS